MISLAFLAALAIQSGDENSTQLLKGFKYMISSPDPSKPESFTKTFEYPVRGSYFDFTSRDIHLPHYGFTYFRESTPTKDSGLPISSELIASLEGKTLALVGFENDHYEKLENGTWIHLPMYKVYNHHSGWVLGNCASYAHSIEGRGTSHTLPKGYGCEIKIKDGKVDGTAGAVLRSMVIHGEDPFGQRNNFTLPAEATRVPPSDYSSYFNALNECPCIHGKGYKHSKYGKAPGGIGCCPDGFTNLDKSQTAVINASRAITFHHRYRVHYEIVDDSNPNRATDFAQHEIVATDWEVHQAPPGTAPEDAIVWKNKSLPLTKLTGTVELLYVTIHVHAPAAKSFFLYETTGGKRELLCEVPIVYGQTDELWDEKGYLHTIPCVWGHEEGLATPPIIYENSTYEAAFSYNTTYPRYGVMSQVITQVAKL